MNVPAHRLPEHIGRQINYQHGALRGTVNQAASDGVTVSVELSEEPGMWWHLPAYVDVKVTR